jgi:hypothetical protein
MTDINDVTGADVKLKAALARLKKSEILEENKIDIYNFYLSY